MTSEDLCLLGLVACSLFDSWFSRPLPSLVSMLSEPLSSFYFAKAVWTCDASAEAPVTWRRTGGWVTETGGSEWWVSEQGGWSSSPMIVTENGPEACEQSQEIEVCSALQEKNGQWKDLTAEWVTNFSGDQSVLGSPKGSLEEFQVRQDGSQAQDCSRDIGRGSHICCICRGHSQQDWCEREGELRTTFQVLLWVQTLFTEAGKTWWEN